MLFTLRHPFFRAMRRFLLPLRPRWFIIAFTLQYTFFKGERLLWSKSKRQAAAIILITVFLVALTRGLTISHNMELHSDEHVFFTAAQSLKGLSLRLIAGV